MTGFIFSILLFYLCRNRKVSRCWDFLCKSLASIYVLLIVSMKVESLSLSFVKVCLVVCWKFGVVVEYIDDTVVAYVDGFVDSLTVGTVGHGPLVTYRWSKCG